MAVLKLDLAAARCARLTVCFVACALLLLPAAARGQATEEDGPAYSERLMGPSTAYLRDPEFSEEKIAAVFERFAKMMEQAHLLPPELLEVASVAAADAAMEEVVTPNSAAAAPPEGGGSSGASSAADADVRQVTGISSSEAADVVLNKPASAAAGADQASPASASPPGAAGLDSSQQADPVLMEEAPPAPQAAPASSTQASGTGRRLQNAAHSTKGTAASHPQRKQQDSGPSKQAAREQSSQADAGTAGEAADAEELAGFKISSDSKDSKGRRTITIDIPITDEALQELAASIDSDDEDPQLSTSVEDLPAVSEDDDATSGSGRPGKPFVRADAASAASHEDAHQAGGVDDGDDPIDAALQRLLAMAADHESDEVLEDDDTVAGARPLLEPSEASGQADDSSEPDDDIEQQLRNAQRSSTGGAQAGADRDSSEQQDDASDDPLVWLKQMAGLVSPEAAAAANKSVAHAMLGRIIHLGRHAGSIHRSYSQQQPDASSSTDDHHASGAEAPAGNCDAGSAGGCSDADSETSLGPEAATRRRLQQALGASTGGGPASLFSSAFKLIFGNALDLFIGGRFPALILGDLRNTIANYNWIRDLADFVDAPLENFVNANYLPLPQDNDQFNNLVRRFLLDYCAVEAAESSSQVLAEFRGPRYRVRIQPLTCPITKDQATGRRVLNVRRCTPAQLVITTEPYIIRGPHRSTVSYLGAECRFNAYGGSDVFYTLGAGTSSYTLRRSTRGVDLVPVVNQYNLAQSFFPVFFRTPNRRPPPPAPPRPPGPPPPAASAAG